MRRLIVLLLLSHASTARAEEVIAALEWSETTAPEGTQARDGALRVEGSTTASRFEIWSLTHPPRLSSGRWAIRGKVAGDRVSGDAYLELWNTLPGGEKYFSRTVADDGPLGKIRGTFAARDFFLPFDAIKPMSPEKLELAVVLPGAGAIEIGPLELVAFESSQEMAKALGSEEVQDARFGWIGAIYGSLIGLLGALIGLLSAFGRFQKVSQGLVATGAILSAAMAAWGAVLLSQGRNFPLPLIIVAAVMALVFALIGQVVQKRR